MTSWLAGLPTAWLVAIAFVHSENPRTTRPDALLQVTTPATR